MIPLEEEIQKLKNKDINTYKAGDQDRLNTLRRLQREQSEKGGPVKDRREQHVGRKL